MVRKLFLTIAIATFSMSIFAQAVEEVTLTVSGDGATKTEATQLALRSAIEQAFGVFVSANTQILNDELVKDEIATVSSGNIKAYKEIADIKLPNGNTSVTLQATVSISKLITYAQTKGSSAEFAGATFGMNMKLKELNKANEEKAIENMIAQLEALIPSMFDYKLELGEPKVNSKGDYDIPAEIVIIPNENTKIFSDIFFKTLSSLSLSADECIEYYKLQIEYYKLQIGDILFIGGGRFIPNIVLSKINKDISKYIKEYIHNYSIYVSGQYGDREFIDIRFFFRSKKSSTMLNQYFTSTIYAAFFDFIIADNLNDISMFTPIHRDYNDITMRPNEIGANIWSGMGLLKGNNLYSNSISIDNSKERLNFTNHNNNDKILQYLFIPFLFDNEKTYNMKLKLTIPKDDIMKYNNFTITHKEH